MQLSQITLKDFRCFFGEHAIEFSNDSAKNVTLIHAENGVGKTTVLNSLIWCFYGKVTAKFEKRDDLVNYDALAAGRKSGYVEVLFEHNEKRYRARRYTKNSGVDRDFTIQRIDAGHHSTLPHPEMFINTVMPQAMAGHFLFDGEHAEVFLGEDNRATIRSAVQNILGCSLIKTAIEDLGETATYYRKQMPSTKSATQITGLSAQIDTITSEIKSKSETKEKLAGDIEVIEQQIADIEEKLRNSEAAKAYQLQRDRLQGDLARARKREKDAKDELLKWLGDNGSFLVSTRITDQAVDYLNQQETKGRIPSPYNEEFVQDILELEKCICGAPLHPGSPGYVAVSALLQKAANATLRSRVGKVKARLNLLKSQRENAPRRLEEANRRLAEAAQDISRHEVALDEISEKLTHVNFQDIADRELKRNQLRREANQKHEYIGNLNRQIQSLEMEKATAERDLKKSAAEDLNSQIFLQRYSLCEALKKRLEDELAEEEKVARSVLRASISKILAATSRKNFRLSMSDQYAISLVNDAGTQLPKSSGENQLLGLAFTAALVEFAKLRQSADDYRLLRGTVAPLVLDSPFGQLDEDYRKTTSEFIPEMAEQVVLLVSKSQSSGGVLDALRNRIGAEYVMVRHNRDAQEHRTREMREFSGKGYETAVFDADHDGSSFVKVAT